MRKHLLLVFALAALVCAGCGNDQYAIEKKFWQAKRQADKVFANPHATPPNELQRVVERFNALIQKFPKSMVALESDFTIARLYLVKQEYEQARAQLRMIVKKYAQFPSVCAEALFLAGNSFQLQDKWNLALEQYKKIMQEYSISLKGLEVPVYIAQYYKIKFQPERMIDAYKSAIAHYNALAKKHANTPLAFMVNKLSAQCFIAIKDWDGALSTYRAMTQEYRGKVQMSEILLDMALISYRELKDKESAKEYLQTLVKEYPKSRFARAANALLKKLERE